MTEIAPWSNLAEAELSVTDARDVARRTAEHLAGHGGSLTETTEGWTIDFGLRRSTIRVAGDRIALRSEGRDASLEQEMRLDLAGHLAEFGGPAHIDWPGADPIVAPPSFRLMTVEAVSDLTPHMRRVRLRGPDLLRFATLRAMHCKLLIPPRDTVQIWPSLDPDGRLTVGNGIARKYTIRAVDPVAGWMDVDFVIHEVAGPGSDWASQAAPGQRLGLTGPGGGGIRLGGPILMAGDATALPAIARAIEACPHGLSARALIEVSGPGEIQQIDNPAGVAIDWIETGTARPSARLAEAVADLAPHADTSVWVGCEFDGFRAIRSDLRGRLAHPRDRHLVVSYWRNGMAADRMERRILERAAT